MKKAGVWILVNVLVFIGVFTFIQNNFVIKYNTDEMIEILEEQDLSTLMKAAEKNKDKYQVELYNDEIAVLEEDSYIKEVDSKEILNLQKEKKDFYLYIGRDNCEYCQKFLPDFSKELKKEKKQVLYLDSNVQKNEHKKEFEEVTNEFKVKGVPSLIKISNGTSEEYGEKEEDLTKFLNKK